MVAVGKSTPGKTCALPRTYLLNMLAVGRSIGRAGSGCVAVRFVGGGGGRDGLGRVGEERRLGWEKLLLALLAGKLACGSEAGKPVQRCKRRRKEGDECTEVV